MAPSAVYAQAQAASSKAGQKRKRQAAQESEDAEEVELSTHSDEESSDDEGVEAEMSLSSDVNASFKGKGKAAEQADDELPNGKKSKVFKQKTLILSSRGITHRMRHMMKDLAAMLPHSKTDAKLDTKHQLSLLNELADLSNCSSALFFEARRHADLYMWASMTPNGPSARFQLLNAHTMDELKMTGNCLKGSRPIVVFDKTFDESAHWRLMKELLMQTFAVSKSARRAKPFVDHITSFSIADDKIWFRNYQIVHDAPLDLTTSAALEAVEAKSAKTKLSKRSEDNISLNEIGPRFVLIPVKIFEGSFGGAVVWENKQYVTPTAKSAAAKAERAVQYNTRKDAQIAKAERSEFLLQQEQAERQKSGKAALAKSRVFA